MSPALSFAEAAAWLDGLQQFKIKLGLDTTRELLVDLGNPERGLPVLHIAGTNGKGSVGATLSAILDAAGYCTGFYSSPHLSCVRERFRLNGECISESRFAALVEWLRSVLGSRQPTYFEAATLMALLWFAEKRVDAAILETGMGGRLDATNVVTPLVSIITDISRDHEQHLGTTIASIAREKAGIVKPGVPVVCSGRETEAIPVIAARCQDCSSPLFLHGRDFAGSLQGGGRFAYRPINGPTRNGLQLALAGTHQAVNTALALAALELLKDHFPRAFAAVPAGLAQVRWPGRMEELTTTVCGLTRRFLLDGAHNLAGVQSLVHALARGWPRQRLLLVWGTMADKDITPGLLALLPLTDRILFTQAETVRSAAPQALLAQLPPDLHHRAVCTTTVEEALTLAAGGSTPDDLICVAGSLYLVGRARQLLIGKGCA